MDRREFIGTVAGAVAAGALARCAISPGKGDVVDAAAFHASRRLVATPFGRISCFERGSGDTVLFLHGFPLNGFQWRGAIERLSSDRRCLAPDFLGMGYTEVAPGQGVGPDDQVDMLIALLDSLAIPAVDVIANDSGGAVAQLLLVRHPERVRTLLLTNCDAQNDSPPPALLPVIELAKAGRFVDEWLGPWRADKTLARSAEGIGGMCYADLAHPTDEAIETYFAPLLSSPERKAQAHAYAIALERNALEGINRLLEQSTAPARIVWGTGDTIFSAASAGQLDAAFGNSRGVRRLEGRKLFWPEELPEVIAEEARLLWS